MQSGGRPALLHVRPRQRPGQMGTEHCQVPLLFFVSSISNGWDSVLSSSRLVNCQRARRAGSYAGTQWATSRSPCMWRTTKPSTPAGRTVRFQSYFSVLGCFGHHIHHPIHHWSWFFRLVLGPSVDFIADDNKMGKREGNLLFAEFVVIVMLMLCIRSVWLRATLRATDRTVGSC